MSSADNLSRFQFWKTSKPRGEFSGAKTTIHAYSPSSGDDPVGVLEVTHRRATGSGRGWDFQEGEADPEIHQAESPGRRLVGHRLGPSARWEDQGVNPGQQQWAGGNFDPVDPGDVSRVSWLSMSEHSPALLKGLMASAVTQTGGERLHADYDLSEAGARISRGMNRKMGLPAHPKNPEMTATFEDVNDVQGAQRLRVNTAIYGDPDQTEDIPDAHVAQDVRAVFAKPPWMRTPRNTGEHQERLPGF